MEDDAVADTRKRACKDGARLIVAIAVMLLLVWVVHTGYKLETEARRHTGTLGSEDNYIVLLFGVVTVVFGSVYFIIGLIIVAELLLDLLTWFRTEEGMETTNDQEKEQKTISQLTIQISVTIGSMFMLTWAIYHGYKLAMEAPKSSIHNGLAFLIGYVAMGFGFIYFIIGIGVVAESTLYLCHRLQQVIERDICPNQDTDAFLSV